MSRLLFIAAVVAVVYLLLRSYTNRAAGGVSPRTGQPGPAEDMVRCVYCGVHLPKSESILSGGNYYCCDAHRRAHQPPPASRDAG